MNKEININEVSDFNRDLEKLIGKTITNIKCDVSYNKSNSQYPRYYSGENFVLEFEDGYFFIGYNTSVSCCEDVSSWCIDIKDRKKLISTVIESLAVTGDTDDYGCGGGVSLELNGEEVFSFSNDHNGYYSHGIVFQKNANSESVLFEMSL